MTANIANSNSIELFIEQDSFKSYLLQAIQQETAFSFYGVCDCDLDIEGDKLPITNDGSYSSYRTPISLLGDINQSQAVKGGLTVLPLYDNQDEYGHVMPRDILFCFSHSDMQNLGSAIRTMFSLLNINSEDDIVRLTNTLKETCLTRNIDFSFNNIGFEVGGENEKMDIIEFRYYTQINLMVTLKNPYLLDPQSANELMITLLPTVKGRDINAKTFVEIPIRAVELYHQLIKA